MDGQPPRRTLFITDDQIVQDLAVIARQLEQDANGLDHLLALVPSIARSLRAERQRLDRLAELIQPSSRAA